jgi:hypothetical protein
MAMGAMNVWPAQGCLGLENQMEGVSASENGRFSQKPGIFRGNTESYGPTRYSSVQLWFTACVPYSTALRRRGRWGEKWEQPMLATLRSIQHTYCSGRESARTVLRQGSVPRWGVPFLNSWSGHPVQYTVCGGKNTSSCEFVNCNPQGSCYNSASTGKKTNHLWFDDCWVSWLL